MTFSKLKYIVLVNTLLKNRKLKDRPGKYIHNTVSDKWLILIKNYDIYIYIKNYDK